jgi:hypothetical protein
MFDGKPLRRPSYGLPWRSRRWLTVTGDERHLSRCGLVVDGRHHQEMADRLANAQVPINFDPA